MKENKDIERSIIKTYRKRIWAKFIDAINEYKLISEGDKIAVCISGGKDSFLMAKCFQEIQRHGKMNFELKFLVMNPGYAEKNVNLIKANAEQMQIPIEMRDSDIFEVVDLIGGGSPCYLCAKMRRGFLYDKAQELGCNKIALGHHFDDVIETLLLSMFYGAELKTMLPKLKSTNHTGMELIRPLFKVKEKDIIAWVNYNELKFLNCACKFTEGVETRETSSKRKEVKNFIKQLTETYDQIDRNIFYSIHNVNLDTFVRYKLKGEEHSFLDDYDEE